MLLERLAAGAGGSSGNSQAGGGAGGRLLLRAGGAHAGMSPTSTSPVAVVTGGPRRLGRHLCKGLAARGYDVVILYRESEAEARSLERGDRRGRPTRARDGRGRGRAQPGGGRLRRDRQRRRPRGPARQQRRQLQPATRHQARPHGVGRHARHQSVRRLLLLLPRHPADDSRRQHHQHRHGRPRRDPRQRQRHRLLREQDRSAGADPRPGGGLCQAEDSGQHGVARSARQLHRSPAPEQDRAHHSARTRRRPRRHRAGGGLSARRHLRHRRQHRRLRRLPSRSR